MSVLSNSRELYMRLMTYVTPYWRQFAGAIVAMVLLAATQAGFAALLKPLLDEGFVKQDPDALAWLPFAIIGIALVRAFTTFASSFGMSWVTNRVVMDIRQRIFDRYLTLPVQFIDDHPTGKLVSKVVYESSQVTKTATTAVTVLVRDSVTIIALLAWMFYLNWQLSLITFALVPITAVIARTIGSRLRRNSRDLQERMGDMTHVLEESINGHRVVRLHGGQEYEIARFHDVSNWVRRLEVKLNAASAFNVSIVEFVAAGALAVIAHIGGILAIDGELTAGGFVSFVTSMTLLFSPIKALSSLNAVIQRGLAASESIFTLLDEPTEKDDGTQQLKNARGEVRFKEVSFSYAAPRDQAVLSNISFDAAPGMIVALVGPSGSGKTTLVNLIPRFYAPQSGSISIDGVDISQVPLANLRAQLATVSQDVVLFDDTVAANIAYGMDPWPGIDAIRNAARKANALDFIEAMDNGFETQVGERGVRLSGGQKQRIAIARALLRDAPVLILDEATSALDTESERLVQEALENLEENRTTIVIAHRLSTVENADLILVMRDGRIVERGTHAQLLEQQGLYEKLYRTQLKED